MEMNETTVRLHDYFIVFLFNVFFSQKFHKFVGFCYQLEGIHLQNEWCSTICALFLIVIVA